MPLSRAARGAPLLGAFSLLILSLVSVPAASAPRPEGWDDRFAAPGIKPGPGFDNGYLFWYRQTQHPVQRLRVLDDHLFILGNHEGTSDVPSRDVLAWDGRRFQGYGDQLAGTAFDAAVFQDELVVGGVMLLEESTGVARWDGSGWSALGGGEFYPSRVDELLVVGNELVAQGFVVRTPGVLATLARFDGSDWHSFPVPGDPNLDEDGLAFEVAGRLVLQRGDWFVWTGQAWADYDVPLADVQPLASDGVLWGTTSSKLVRWDGQQRREFRRPDVQIDRVFAYGDVLLLLATDGTRYRWEGGRLQTLPGAAEGGEICDEDAAQLWCPRVASLAVFQHRIFSGGNFTWDSRGRVGHLSQWDDRRWVAVEPAFGLDLPVRFLTSFGSRVVTNAQAVRGELGYADEGLAAWDGRRWTSFPNEGQQTPLAAVSYQGHLVVSAVPGVRTWRGRTWRPLGEGSPAHVQELAVVGSSLFAASRSALFEYANGAWSQLVTARQFGDIVQHDGDLVVAGEFDSIGGVEALNVARWDGEQWHALGAGVPIGGARLVNALFSDRQTGLLYAGLADAGASPLNDETLYVFRDGRWDALGLRAHSVFDVVRHRGVLVVGGREFDVEGVSSTLVMQHGENWCGLGVTSGSVTNLLSRGNDLYAGGSFRQIDGRESRFVAHWPGRLLPCSADAPHGGDVALDSQIRRAAVSIASVSPNPFNPSTRIRFQLAAGGSAQARIVDLLGRVVRTFQWTDLAAGEHSFTWHGADDADQRVASGVYLLEIRVGATRDVRRLVLLK